MSIFDQIDWSKVLLGQRIIPSQSVPKCLSRLVVRGFGTFLQGSLSPVAVGTTTALFVKSMRRVDYDAQWELVLGCFDGDKQVVDLSWSRRLSFASLRRWSRVVQAFRYTNSSRSLLNRLLDTLLCMYYLDVLHAFFKARPKFVVTFAEMRPVENVLVQWFNLQGIKTITLQHGLYIDYGSQRTINRLNYEASCAQIFLAWGQETVDLVTRFNPSAKAVVCGAPQIAEPSDELAPPCIYVVFDGDINQEQNRQLLKVGKELGRELELEIVVGLHPRNQKSLYELVGVSFLPNGDDYARSGFVLGHTTTQIIKLARFGKRVFKLRSEEPCNRLIPESVQFTTIEELRNHISAESYPDGWAQAHIHSIAASSLQYYKEFFKAIC